MTEIAHLGTALKSGELNCSPDFKAVPSCAISCLIVFVMSDSVFYLVNQISILRVSSLSVWVLSPFLATVIHTCTSVVCPSIEWIIFKAI